MFWKPEDTRMATDMKVKEVKKIIRTCIETQKYGLTSSELRAEYCKRTGEDIPFHSLGYHSLYHLIQDTPEIKSEKNFHKGHVLVLKTDSESTRTPLKKIHREHNEKQDHRVATEAEVEQIKKTIRSCIRSQKCGLTRKELYDEYLKRTGKDIPLERLGCNSLSHLLWHMPEVKSEKNAQKGHVFVVKSDPKTSRTPLKKIHWKKNEQQKANCVSKWVQNQRNVRSLVHRSHRDCANSTDSISTASSLSMECSSDTNLDDSWIRERPFGSINKSCQRLIPDKSLIKPCVVERLVPGKDKNYWVSTELEKEEVTKTIQSCIESQKCGLTREELCDEYRKKTGKDIPLDRLGYNSLSRLLWDMPEVKSEKNVQKGHVLVLKTAKKNTRAPLKDVSREKKTNLNQRYSRISGWVESQKTKRFAIHESRRNYAGSTTSVSSRSTSSRLREQNHEHPFLEENHGEPWIVERWFPEKSQRESCEIPMIGDSQLIGDDYFLQLATKYTNETLTREFGKSAIACGTVQSGLTIKGATNRLENIRLMSKKLVINVGSADVYNCKTFFDMIDNYTELLDVLITKYEYSSEQITLCTLPPLANIGVLDKLRTHAKFNLWLRNFAKEQGYNLLDLHNEFTNEFSINDKLFQNFKSNVSGTVHPPVLWNYHGRQKAMKLLLSS